MFRELGVFEYHSTQRDRFRAGELWQEWAKAYPDVFDDKDVAIARNQAGPKMGLHFFEWLAAVLIYQSFGYLSLLQQYEFKAHDRKRRVLRELVTAEVFSLITNHGAAFGGVQSPDLLVYARDRSDWFFCEVKGPTDRLRDPQRKYFDALSDAIGRDIRVIRFKLPTPEGS